MITTFKQIKEIIEPITAEQFCKDDYENHKGQCCFLGHIQKHITGSSCEDGDGFGARLLTHEFLESAHGVFLDGADVNNSPDVNGYTEPIIKDRLMHMIEDGIVWENERKNKTT